MSQLTDTVFREVCLDERVSDGIFRLDNSEHMDALRDHFIKKGITKEASIHVTNRMVEGKYPDRQAWRKEDGILVTWPSPKHMAKAMKENPGKYTDKNPSPKPEEPPQSKEEPLSPPQSKEEPKSADTGGDTGDNSRIGSIFSNPTTVAGNLEVEPPRGDQKPVPISNPVPSVAPRTPERIAAEKEVVKQIINMDDNAMSKIDPSISEECHKQLSELYKRADELHFKEAVTFLTPYIRL